MIRVHDGDTVTVLVNQRQVNIRLDEIDAPELKQAFGQRSRESLAAICAGQQAIIVDKGQDKYRRTIGRVTCGTVDANAHQVRVGMAWVFDQYSRPDSPLYPLQNAARSERIGLWIDPSPTPPWVWRHPPPKAAP